MAEIGQIISKPEFMNNADYSKEQYEGLIVSSDLQQGCYNIGVQLGENQVLVVDQSTEADVREKIINTWAPQIQEIQRQHRGVNTDLQNYTSQLS